MQVDAVRGRIQKPTAVHIAAGLAERMDPFLQVQRCERNTVRVHASANSWRKPFSKAVKFAEATDE